MYYPFLYWIVFYWIHYFSVTYFSWYKEYIICLIQFSNYEDVLPAFTCARAICLTVNILTLLPCVKFIGNNSFLKPLSVNSWPL